MHSRTRARKATIIATVLLAPLLGFAGACDSGSDDETNEPTPELPLPQGRADVVPDSWTPVAARLQAIRKEAQLEAIAVVVRDARSGNVDFRLNMAGWNPRSAVPVASAGKWVGAAVVMAVVDERKLNLSSTTGQVLGWTGPQAAITLEQLLSLSSGLPLPLACLGDPNATLASCARDAGRQPLTSAPGSTFEYGSVHLAVAGAMAERATGLTFDQLLAEKLRKPLGMSVATRFYANPIARRGANNPSLGGGLVTTLDDYERFLAMMAADGTFAGRRVLSADAVRAMRIDRTADRKRASSSQAGGLFAKFHYGLGQWLECESKGCENDPASSSLGSFGWYPWIDHGHGYTGLVAMSFVTDDPAAFARGAKAVFAMKAEVTQAARAARAARAAQGVR
jgi:CubicO group peptidase (beta-lactamase class C family)